MKTALEIIVENGLDRGGEFNTIEECDLHSNVIMLAMKDYAEQVAKNSLKSLVYGGNFGNFKIRFSTEGESFIMMHSNNILLP